MLRAEEIAVVTVDLSRSLEAESEQLSADERMRAARFIMDRDRKRFIASHGALRAALGAVTRCDPRTLQFQTGPRGKPYLCYPTDNLHFNLSHSGDRALIAIAV